MLSNSKDIVEILNHQFCSFGDIHLKLYQSLTKILIFMLIYQLPPLTLFFLPPLIQGKLVKLFWNFTRKLALALMELVILYWRKWFISFQRHYQIFFRLPLNKVLFLICTNWPKLFLFLEKVIPRIQAITVLSHYLIHAPKFWKKLCIHVVEYCVFLIPTYM